MRFILSLLLLAFGPVNAEIRVDDDLGLAVELDAQANRIVSLAPHLTEILFSLGVGEKIVGTVRYSDYPPEAKQIPQLGDAFSLNIEAVLAMRPDLIFAWHTGGINKPVQRLKDLGVPVFINESSTLTSIADGIARIATLVGVPGRGKILSENYLMQLDSLRVKADSAPVVFFQVSDQDLYTVNSSHLIGQAIEHCGGNNLFSDLKPKVALVSKEAVVNGQPDLILITSASPGIKTPWADRWESYDSLKGRISFIDPNLISRPSYRMLEGINSLCDIISGSKRLTKI